jgi:hypothetical protein
MENAIWMSDLEDATPGSEKGQATLYLRDNGGFTPAMRVRLGGIVEVNTITGWQALALDSTVPAGLDKAVIVD